MKLDAIKTNFLKGANAIQKNRYVNAITAGLVTTLPVTIVGSIGTLINSLPIDGYQKFLTSTGLKAVTGIPNEVTNNIISLYAVYLIAKKLAESFDIDGNEPGLLSLMSFLIISPYLKSEAGTMIGLSSTWLGGMGMFSAFIISLFVARLYVFIVGKGWTIKMPDGVPTNVAKSFSAMIPSLMIMLLMLAVRFVFLKTTFGDFHSFIFEILTKPLTSIGGSFGAMLFATVLAHVLWLFGIHGVMVVGTVFFPIWNIASLENLAAFNAGLPAPHSVSIALFMQCGFMGSGQTLGLVLSMIRAKAGRYKQLGKLTLIPNICGINEPVVFGTPLVMNFKLAVPFVMLPVLSVLLGYIGMEAGILPRLPGINAPLGTPVIISGILASGGQWQWGVYQAMMIVLSYVIYKPFFSAIDRDEYRIETQKNQEA